MRLQQVVLHAAAEAADRSSDGSPQATRGISRPWHGSRLRARARGMGHPSGARTCARAWTMTRGAMPRSQGERRARRRPRQPWMAIAASFLLGEAARVRRQSFLMGDHTRGCCSSSAAGSAVLGPCSLVRCRRSTPSQTRWSPFGAQALAMEIDLRGTALSS
jgi:hypothetical protein